MMSPEMAQDLAAKHETAEQTRQQFSATSQFTDGLTIDDAYTAQEAWVALKQSKGRKITGRKIGLTSRAMQSAMQIHEPDFGTLLDDMCFENGATLEADRFCDPRLEAELAFVLKKDLMGEALSVEDVMEATDYIVPALELIAARTYRKDPDTGYTRKIFDTIADNAANAGYILGETKIPGDADLAWVGATLSRNGVIEETGLAAGVLGHPARGIVWLARRFAKQGIGLEAGHVYLAGSFTRPVIVSSGDDIIADYGRYGEIRLQFS